MYFFKKHFTSCINIENLPQGVLRGKLFKFCPLLRVLTHLSILTIFRHQLYRVGSKETVHLETAKKKKKKKTVLNSNLTLENSWKVFSSVFQVEKLPIIRVVTCRQYFDTWKITSSFRSSFSCTIQYCLRYNIFDATIACGLPGRLHYYLRSTLLAVMLGPITKADQRRPPPELTI